MIPSLADVAAALHDEPDQERRAALGELALALLRLGIGRREIGQLGVLLCRLTMDERSTGGDDDRRDPAAA